MYMYDNHLRPSIWTSHGAIASVADFTDFYQHVWRGRNLFAPKQKKPMKVFWFLEANLLEIGEEMNILGLGISDGGMLMMSFPAANFPPSVVLSRSTNSRRWKRNPFPACIKQESSLNESTCEGGNPSDCNKIPSPPGSTLNRGKSPPNMFFGQENTVGIIGGVSVFSTLIFLEKLVWLSTKQRESSAVPFILCSDPTLKQQVHSSTRRSIAINRQRDSSESDEEPNMVVEKLRQKTEFLEESGARCIVMPCHISHAWYKEISENCSLPFLHMGECVAQELKDANLKPVETASHDVRIGVIAAEATTAGYYQEKIESQGFEVVLPDQATMEHMVNPAIKALNRKDVEGARNLLRIAVQVLLVMKAANVVILASDELQGLLPRDDPLIRRCIDPMDVLARSTVKWAQSVEAT